MAMKEFDQQYQDLTRRIMTEGAKTTNKRTGEQVRELPHQRIQIHGDQGYPFLTLRRLRPEACTAEMLWSLSGSRRPADFLTRHAHFWDDFTLLDGVVTSAYGYRWRREFGRDQILDLINLLTVDPTSRHGTVLTWDPRSDGLNPDKSTQKKNIPCLPGFTVNIIGGKLHLHNWIRSNDDIPGLPYDVAAFALLQRLLAAHFRVGIGTYTHDISNAHIYQRHFVAARTLIRRTNDHPPIHFELQPDYLTRALNSDRDPDVLDDLTIEIANLIKINYHPLPGIKGITVAL